MVPKPGIGDVIHSSHHQAWALRVLLMPVCVVRLPNKVPATTVDDVTTQSEFA